jgi:hypothetical protein
LPTRAPAALLRRSGPGGPSSAGRPSGFAVLVGLAGLCGLTLSGCPNRSQPRQPVTEDAPKPRQPERRGYARCLAPPAAEQGEKELTIAGVRLTQRGERLVATDPRDRTPGQSDGTEPRLALGIVADTRQATPSTLETLEGFDEAFEKAGVDATVVLGGIDPTFEGTRQVLGRLAARRPLLALPGDLCSREGFRAAMREMGPDGIDLTLVHVVELPYATLVAVPGFFLPHHLAAKAEGCGYDQSDLSRLEQLLSGTRSPRLLLAHTPPRGRGAAAVDRSFGALNIGDPQLTRLIERGTIQAGLFAHLYEAAGHATTADQEPLAAQTWSETLWLNVGSADSGPHEHLERGWVGPTAAIVELQRGKWRYRLIGGF